MSLEHGNHQLGMFSDVNFHDDDLDSDVRCWWQGCGNIQPNLGGNSKHFTGSFAGEQKERISYSVFIPNDSFTRNAIKQRGIYVVSLEPSSIYYSDIFACQADSVQATPDNCWLRILCHKEFCSGCKEKDMWCGAATSCPNGVVFDYDPVECPDLCEWLNCQTPGTTVCLPSGEYDACEIKVPFLCIQAQEEAEIVINGDWVLAEGVKVLV